jgi:hypothetical protein
VATGANGFLAEDGTRRCSVFKFENLDARKVSLELFRTVVKYTERLTNRNHHFFNIAKGSVYEVVSIAHVLRQENLYH